MGAAGMGAAGTGLGSLAAGKSTGESALNAAISFGTGALLGNLTAAADPTAGVGLEQINSAADESISGLAIPTENVAEYVGKTNTTDPGWFRTNVLQQTPETVTAGQQFTPSELKTFAGGRYAVSPENTAEGLGQYAGEFFSKPQSYAPALGAVLSSGSPEIAEEQPMPTQRKVAPSYYGSKVAKGGKYKGGPDAQSALDIALGRKRNEQLITPTTFEANPQYGLTGMMATGGAIRKMAQDLQKKGNNGDTILAHINPKEAKMLKASGGSGTVNPKTGLLQFEDDSSAGDWAGSAGADGEGGGGASMGGGDDTGGTGNDGGASADGMGGYAGGPGPGPDAGPDGGAPENMASPWSNPDLAEPSLETLSEPGGALGTGGSSAGRGGGWGDLGGGKDGLGTQDVKSLNDYPNKDEAEAPENPGPNTSGVSEYNPGFLGHVGDYMRSVTYDLRNDPLATMVNVGVALAPGLQGIGLANTAMGAMGKGTIGSAVSGYFSPTAQAEREQAKTNEAEWAAHNSQMAGAPVASAPTAPGVGFNMGPDGGSSGVQPYYPPRVAQGGGLVSLATGGQITASQGKEYFEGQVEGNGDGMSDEVPFDIHNSNPDKALLSKDEYVLPADVVSMIGNGSSNAGSKEIDRFVAHIRKKAHGVSKQQKQLKGDKGLRSLVA
jgi:hypothetical protein